MKLTGRRPEPRALAGRPVERAARRVELHLAVPVDAAADRAAAVVADPRFGRVAELRADTRPDGAGGSVVELSVAAPPRVPYFAWFVRVVGWWVGRGDLREAAAAISQPGEPVRPPRRVRLLLPPAGFTPAQAATLGTVAAVGTLANFGASLLTQGGSAVVQTFGRSDAALSFALALTRVGVVVALVAAALADRFGRRRLLLVGLAGICVANVVSAAAPTFAVFTVAQVFVRGFVEGTLLVAAIVVIEEAPEGARAYALSMLGLALGVGFGLSVALLPLADLGSIGWRLMFLASGGALVLLPGLARRLPESHRFAGLARRRRPGGQLSRYGRRFLLLGVVAFLLSVFGAPSTQLLNRYLNHVHHFSNAEIAGFRAVTAGVPGFLGIALGGQLAETLGRRLVTTVALVVATVSLMAFFVTGGSLLWVTQILSILAAASAGVALGALDVELFPTELRGSTNGMLLVCGVSGSVVGLLLVALLEGPLGGLGPAIAVCGAAPLLAALVVVPFLPETATRRLDEVSPTRD